MSSRSAVWLLTLPLAVVGSQIGHALAYRLVASSETERKHELASTGHAYMAYAPAALAVCSVLVVVALAVELAHLLTDRRSAQPSALTFAVLAPAIFVCQEHFERLLHDGVFPWEAALQPTFIVGLLLQLPFAIAAYLLARLLLRAVRSLGLLLSDRPRSAVRVSAQSRPLSRVARPRVPALALGYGSRGPPALSR